MRYDDDYYFVILYVFLVLFRIKMAGDMGETVVIFNPDDAQYVYR
jgi:hypothetical protein